MTSTPTKPAFTLITLTLPGPDRKRTAAPYHFRVTYRNPDMGEPGCVMTWEVTGGREAYQVAVERTPGGEHVWHCTCPDAVYRGDDGHAHVCKHVHGLMSLFETIGVPVRRNRAAA